MTLSIENQIISTQNQIKRINTYGENDMKIKDIIEDKTVPPLKPKTPDQMRIIALKAGAARAKGAVKAERERQKIKNAATNLANIQRLTPSI